LQSVGLAIAKLFQSAKQLERYFKAIAMRLQGGRIATAKRFISDSEVIEERLQSVGLAIAKLFQSYYKVIAKR
jgi:predicted ribonuclease toxin of YeeF-YezG toxin-antitoxin module